MATHLPTAERLVSACLMPSKGDLFDDILELLKLMFERMKMEKEEGRGRDDLAAPEQRSSRTTTEEQEEEEHPSAGINTAASPTRGEAIRSKIIKLNEKLKKLNSYSSILNILNLMSLTWHLVYLAQSAHHIC